MIECARAVHCFAALDHRASFRRMIAEVDPSAATPARLMALKLLIWHGIASRLSGTPGAGVLVDPDSAPVVAEARAAGAVTALALEASGQRWLAPDRPPTDLAALLAATRPDFGKVLLRWHPHDPPGQRAGQAAMLADLFAVATDGGARTMLELLVPPEGTDVALAADEPHVYRSEVLPTRLADAVQQLADAGIVPDLWKIDGLDRPSAAVLVGHAVSATSDGRAGIVVLGAGGDMTELERWFAVTAGVPGFCGFAIGRSIWWDAVRSHLAGELDEHDAIECIGAAFAAVVAAYRRAVS